MPTVPQSPFRRSNPDYGFTLIEIVAVLVLLGILAATAAPKFFDLGAGSKRLAAGTALNEAQVRINARFSRLMYAGLTCADAVKSVNTLALVADKTQGDEARFGSFLLSPAEKKIPEEGLAVSVRMADDKDHVFQPGSVYVPACAKNENKDSDDDKFPVTPNLPDNSSDKNETNDDNASSGTENGSSGDNESGSSGSSSESGNSTSTGGGGSSGSGTQGNLDPALADVKVFDWEAVESTVTLPAGQLVLYAGKYYVAKMTAVVDTVANKPVGDDALTGYFVEVNARKVLTELSCRAAEPCKPGTLYKDALSGKVYAYVGTVDLYSPTFSETGSEWVALLVGKEIEN